MMTVNVLNKIYIQTQVACDIILAVTAATRRNDSTHVPPVV